MDLPLFNTIISEMKPLFAASEAMPDRNGAELLAGTAMPVPASKQVAFVVPFPYMQQLL